MKTTLITLSTVFMVMTSFKTKHDADVAANRMGLQVVSALHKTSALHYSALYPPVEAFYELMDENTALYGSNFEEAKAIFTSEYEKKVIPAMNHSFERLLESGKKSGIDWRTIKFLRVEQNATERELTFAPMTIVFSANGKEHTLVIENALYFKGQWKVSQHVTLD